VIPNIAAFALNAVVNSPNRQRREKKTYAASATSYTSNEELIGSQKPNIMVDRLTNPPLNVHSCWNLKRTGANSSGLRAAES
jgi:hypothetical protein